MSALSQQQFPGIITDAVKDLIAAGLWSWCHDHWNDKVFVFHILFISLNVHVRDLVPFLELLLGPDTNPGTST